MTRLPALVVGLALLFVTGCGDDDGGLATVGPTSTLPDLECPEARPVIDSQDLIDELALLTWEGWGPYSSGVKPVTADLVITGTVALNASALPVPENCLSRPDCSPQAGLVLHPGVAGAVGEGDAYIECADSYARIVLTDTTVRLRPYLRDTHPCAFNYVPMVEVLPPCGTPCSEGQGLCPVDGVCYSLGDAFCRLCEGGTKEECACRGPEGPLEEGAPCSYWQSGDMKCEGRCRSGACDTPCE
ncbi:MAG: hypothetical protein JW785_05835 [Acidimicrobiia bacterium]|nr:hypothetical protein [Acidimicrobiia bacterium]